MKNFSLSNIIFIFLIFSLSSCDSRVDVFHKLNTPPSVYLSEGIRDFSDSSNVLDISLRHGEEIAVFFDYFDEYLGSNSIVEYVTQSEPYDVDYIDVKVYPSARKVIIKDLLPADTLLDCVEKIKITLKINDYFDDFGEGVINVLSMDNKAPTPIFSVEKINGFEYSVSAQESYDSDGDGIDAFEFLFDGEIIYDKEGFGGIYKSIENPNPGHAAMGGTYIISTSLCTVKHAFQTAGTHTVSVRARDEMGLWSKWSTKKIEVY